MPDLYDITPPVSPNLAVWPGDTPVRREVLCDLANGDSVTLSTLRATVHLGAHADGPNHYGLDAQGIGERDLNYYIGPCLVVRVDAQRGSRVQVQQVRERIENLKSEISDLKSQAPDLKPQISDLKPQISDSKSHISDSNPQNPILESQISNLRSQITTLPSRILIATGTYPDPANFNQDFAGLAPELVDHLHGMGVILIGTDAPSVDLFDSKDLPAHQRFLANDMAILETLLLRDVPEGVYELIAPPLKLMGFDGSPVRAVLRTLPPTPPLAR